jgi:hypothetical protein
MVRKAGTLRNDTLVGGLGHDWLEGLAGNDQLFGGYGNDTLVGGSGDDRLYGGAGADRIEGGLGEDLIFLYDGVRAADTIVYDFVKEWNGTPRDVFLGDDTVANFGVGDRFDVEDVSQRDISHIKILDGADGTQVLFLSGVLRVGSVLLAGFDAKDVAEGRQTSLVVKDLADAQVNKLLNDVLF